MIDLRKPQPITIQFIRANEGKSFLFHSNYTSQQEAFIMDAFMIEHFDQFPEVLYKLSPNFSN